MPPSRDLSLLLWCCGCPANILQGHRLAVSDWMNFRWMCLLEGQDTKTWCVVVPSGKRRVPTACAATSSCRFSLGSGGALLPFPLTQNASPPHSWGLSGHCPWPADCAPWASGSRVSMAVPTSSNHPRLSHPPEGDLPCPCWGCATGGGKGDSKSVHYFQGRHQLKKTL